MKNHAVTYEEDPLLCAATQLLIAHFNEERAAYTWKDADTDKICNIVSLDLIRKKEHGDTAVLWVDVAESSYVLYDRTYVQSLSGSWIPATLTLKRDTSGKWELVEWLQAQDGSDYGPSILAFCEGDEILANQMMQSEASNLWECLLRYLAANGYHDVEEMR